ncbi:hypothetical protein D9758_007612 [Tetrapyrgos nigripes]|uniref:Uncharacterized protein n=1 Tax=Tetrapyrgos nigripes TaxID=182062 RepID=A0A8H5LJZ7_9AGAR|nr:hypothetical protein D9758_007612 [Tetrapyrgos nigripes]
MNYIYLRVFGLDLLVINSYNVAKELLEKRSDHFSDRPRLIMAGEMYVALSLASTLPILNAFDIGLRAVPVLVPYDGYGPVPYKAAAGSNTGMDTGRVNPYWTVFFTAVVRVCTVYGLAMHRRKLFSVFMPYTTSVN